MYPTKSIRKFVCDRLTAVAQEIIGAFESKVVDYEAEIIRQRRLLEKVFTPELKLHRADFQIAHCKREQSVSNQQHCNGTSCSLQDGIHVKDEQEEICIQHEILPPNQVQDTCVSNMTAACKQSVGIEHSNSAPDGNHQVPSHNRCEMPGCAIPTNDTEVLSDGNTIPAGSSERTMIEEINSTVNMSSMGTDQALKEKSAVDKSSQTAVCTSRSVSATIIHQVTNGSLVNVCDTSAKATELPLDTTGNNVSRENTEAVTNESCRKTTTTNRCTDSTPNIENDGENLLTKQAVNKKSFDGEQTSAGCLDHSQSNTSARSDESPPEEGCHEDNVPSTQSIRSLKERKRNDKESSNRRPASKPSETSSPADKEKSSDGISTSGTNKNRKSAIASSTKIRSSGGNAASTTRGNKKVKLMEWTAHSTSGKSSAGEISSMSPRSLSKKELYEEKTKINVDTESAVDLACYRESTTKSQAANRKAREEKTASTLNCKSPEKDKSRKRSAKTLQNETSSISNVASPSTEATHSKKPRDEKVGTKTHKLAKMKKSNDQTTKSARSDKSKSEKDVSSTSKSLEVSPEPAPNDKGSTSNNMDDDENPYKCDRCDKVMSNFKNYKFHLRSHTVDKTFKCNICRTKFRDSWDLKKHMVIHSTEKPFTCDICGSTFNRLFNLNQHRRVHTGEKPYKCSTCEKSFSALVNMKKHMRVHTGEKPYACEDCSKEFSDSSAFKIHQRVHTGEKPFKCKDCKRRFATATTLERHSRTHTGEKPYMCDVCDKAFAYKTDVNRHMRLHTGEKPYECAACGEKFSTWSGHNKHKRKHICD